MNDKNLILGLDVVIAVMAVYIMYCNYKMVKKNEISSLLLQPEEIKKAKDKAGYIKYIVPKLWVFAGVSFVDGVIGVLHDLKLMNIPYWSIFEMGSFLIVVFVFTYFVKTARTKYIV